jgi:5-formyltetrahydrofolate cyclo-ligase
MCRKLKRALRKVRDREMEALKDKHGAEEAQKIVEQANAESAEWSVRSIARRHMNPILDPSRRSFWRRT